MSYYDQAAKLFGYPPQPVNVYSVKPLTPTTPRIDCRTCANADQGACSLFPRQCDEGSAYQATKPVQYWSK